MARSLLVRVGRSLLGSHNETDFVPQRRNVVNIKRIPAALAALCEQTDTEPGDWLEVVGTTTGVGVERSYVHIDGCEAYTVDDQGEISVSVSGD